MKGEGIVISAPSAQHAELLATAIGAEFETAVRDGEGHWVDVTPDGDTSAKLVRLFDAIGQWLAGSGLASCEITFGDRNLTVLPMFVGQPNDPTAFLLERTRQLEQALSSRIVIEQAKGILAERHGVGVDAAFEELRRSARSSRRRIHDVAADVVRGEAFV